MHNCCSIRIERLQNGFTVHMTDPEIVKQNNKRRDAEDGCVASRWRDPEMRYAFDTSDQVKAFITKSLDNALPQEDYVSAFDKAAKEVNDGE